MLNLVQLDTMMQIKTLQNGSPTWEKLTFFPLHKLKFAVQTNNVSSYN